MSSNSLYKNLADMLFSGLETRGDDIAYRFLDHEQVEHSITVNDLITESRKLAAVFMNDIEKNDRIILAARPGLEYIIGLYACFISGAIAVPIFPPATPAMALRFFHIVNETAPKIIVADKKTVQQIKKGKLTSKFIPGKIKKHLKIDDSFFSVFDMLSQLKLPLLSTECRNQFSDVQNLTDTKITREDIAFLQYTSGSTGNPKGVILTHNSLLENMEILRSGLKLHEASHMYSWLPPYHDMGLIGGILSPMYAQRTSTLMAPEQFVKDPFRWLKHITDYKCTTTGAPNFAFDLCIKKINESQMGELDLSLLEMAANGAEPISVSTVKTFYNKFRSVGLSKNVIVPCYGLAECCLMASTGHNLSSIHINKEGINQHKVVMNPLDANSYELISSGVPQIDIQIVNPETSRVCDKNTVGEIWLSGSSIAQGYYNNTTETDKTFRNQIKGLDGKYYLRTGDLGFFNNDELYICGRIKDLIIINGRNYYPHDLEVCVSDVSESVRAGCIIAYSKQVDEHEQLDIVAEIKAEASEEDFGQICSDIRVALSQNHLLQPNHIYLIKQRTIPKTTSGKLQRLLCREKIEKGELKPVFVA